MRDSLYVALANLKANKLRSVFSMLGIVIGTCSVVVVVAMVNGTRESTLRELMEGKSDLLILKPKFSQTTGRFGKLTMEDVKRLKEIPHVRAALADVRLDGTVRGPFAKSEATLMGIERIYGELYKLKVVEGRFFSQEECLARPRICLVTDQMSRRLFGFDYPIGQHIRAQGTSLEVVGLIQFDERLEKMGQRADIYVPVETLARMRPQNDLYVIQLRSQPGKIDAVKTEVLEMIKADPQKADVLELEDPRSQRESVEKWSRAWLLQMSLIAGISLLVGGVGLMNVMLTTVAERTHEIGLRKAVGANSKMILRQFLMESITLSVTGGVIGILAGVLTSYSLNVLSAGKILISVLPASVVASFLFSLAIGIIFGLFPASKAAHLSPVEALRYE